VDRSRPSDQCCRGNRHITGVESARVHVRDDGAKQWAYKGKPLYTWAKDTKPGDITGDGVNNVWHIAKP
jgi:predicted lipoprotein with Yx(FWY)xxD motif